MSIDPRLRDLVKRIPGLVATVRGLRSLRHAALRGLVARAMVWGQGSLARRLLIFEATPEPLAIAVHPQESWLVNTADRIIGRSLYSRCQFDFHKFETACRLLRTHASLADPTVLIDAGANVGSICIPAVRRGWVQSAIAFELDPENTRLLRVNALLNMVEDRIDIRNIALGAASGEVAVKRSASNFGDHRVALDCNGTDTIRVPMKTLDAISGELDLARTILWMDIQGYEGYALQGAGRLLAASVPLIVEFAPDEMESSGSYDLFLSAIAGSSYRVFFDLNDMQPSPHPVSPAALQSLAARLAQQGSFTDLLFLREAGRGVAVQT